MAAPTFKKATDSDPGDATKYGAPDVKYAFDVLDATHSTDRIQASSIETSGASNVQTDLDSKAAVSHTHVEADITDLGNYSVVGHTHVAANVTDFDTEVTNNSAVTANTAKVTNATHTGDVTGSGALTIANSAVTNAKMADMVQNTIKGRITASTGAPEDLTAANVRTIINVADGANNYSHPNHTGDVTSTGDGATAIAAGAIVNADVNASAAIDISKLNITGTPTGSLFLRDDASWQSIPGGGDALTSNPLSQFAATTSAQLAGVISDETGSGALVFGTSPTITTPAISGNMTTTGTIDGRDVAADGSKLDGIEALADVTDTANVNAAAATTVGTITSGTWNGTTIAIANGGTGNTTAQAAIDALSNVSAATNEHVLTKDTGTGNAIWKAATGGLSNVVEDTTPQLGGALDAQGNDINNGGVIFLTEQAAAEVDVAGKGQIWVKTATPNQLWFTDDAGTDTQLGVGGGLSNVVEDTTPQLGGALDCQSNNLTSVGNVTLAAGKKITVDSDATESGFNDTGHTADPSSGAAGDLYYNTTSNTFKFHNGTAWGTFGGGDTVVGTQTKFISAAAIYPGGLNPATGLVTKQFGANDQPIQAIEFPDGADYEAYVQDVLDNWDAGTIKVKYYWFRENDEATPESKTIEFECSGVSLANFGALGGTAYGTAVAVTDTTDSSTAEDKINITAASAAITVAGAGEGEWVSLKIMRDDSAGTLTGSIFLAGVSIEYTIAAGTSTI